MRRTFVLLLIVLMPLPSWAGDLVSLEMARSVDPLGMATVMPAGCPMAAGGDEDFTSAHRDARGPRDLCLLFIAHVAMALPLAPALVVEPAFDGLRLVSAPAALSIRPPIS